MPEPINPQPERPLFNYNVTLRQRIYRTRQESGEQKELRVHFAVCALNLLSVFAEAGGARARAGPPAVQGARLRNHGARIQRRTHRTRGADLPQSQRWHSRVSHLNSRAYSSTARDDGDDRVMSRSRNP